VTTFSPGAFVFVSLPIISGAVFDRSAPAEHGAAVAPTGKGGGFGSKGLSSPYSSACSAASLACSSNPDNLACADLVSRSTPIVIVSLGDELLRTG